MFFIIWLYSKITSTKIKNIHTFFSAKGRNLLTSHFFEYGYGPPGGLCWDEGCGDAPIQVNGSPSTYVPYRFILFHVYLACQISVICFFKES